MKILFVCRGNVARSQMAEAMYNDLTKSSDAESAGTHVEIPGETLGQRKIRFGKSFAVDVMDDAGLPIQTKTQTQLTKEMITKYDLIVNMSGKRYSPKWLLDAPNQIYWKVQDPTARSYEITNRTRVAIEQRVRGLL